MSKKIRVLLSTVFLTLLLTACGGNNQPQPLQTEIPLIVRVEIPPAESRVYPTGMGVENNIQPSTLLLPAGREAQILRGTASDFEALLPGHLVVRAQKYPDVWVIDNVGLFTQPFALRWVDTGVTIGVDESGTPFLAP